MIVIEKTFPRPDMYPLESMTKNLPPVLFDIETTGLSAANAVIYLIGAMEIKRDRLCFIQWFAEKPTEEKEVLEAFLTRLPDHACLISFNGRSFDVPFMCKKCKQYDIPCRLPQMPSVDLYRSFRPLNTFFDLNSRKLKAYEIFIGLEREDEYTGLELIDVYREYVGRARFDAEERERLKALLLLHNEEDITDMVPVTGLLSYLDLLEGNIKDCSITRADGALKLEIELFSDLPVSCEKDIALKPGMDTVRLSATSNRAEIIIPTIKARLRHYFEDYKNYYFLPDEDFAIHKSIAGSVESSHREQARKDTAYTWAEGEFIPAKTSTIRPFFKEEFTDRIVFIPLKNLTKENIREYIKSLLV